MEKTTTEEKVCKTSSTRQIEEWQNTINLSNGKIYSPLMATPKGFALMGRSYNTPALASQSNVGSIFAIGQAIGEEALSDLLFAHITELNVYLNQENHMTTEQVEFIVDELIAHESFRWFSLAELALIIRRIKTSYYGKLYNNFDGCKFFEILRDYDTERTQAIEEVRIKEASQFKGVTIKGFDYGKYKINAENDAKRRDGIITQAQRENALNATKTTEITKKAKEIVDKLGIKDELVWKREFDRVFCELLEGRLK